jgi:DNA end-binding protein Ku
MPRAVWTGSLSFGLVSIPVALYPATSPKDVRFHLFDRQGRRVRHRRVSEDAAWEDLPGSSSSEPSLSSEETEPSGYPVRDVAEHPSSAVTDRSLPNLELRYEDLVRGYEVEPGRFAMVEHEEIERARPERSSVIELEDFVELDDIDPVYFEKTYYVAPRPESAKPYMLLQRTLDRTHRVGIGRFVLRTKPHLVAIRPARDALALETLFFGDEVRSPSDVVISTTDSVTDRELAIAEQLVEMLATTWDPERYADEYRQELLRIIAQKSPVASPDEAEVQPATTPRIEELMDALKRSVEEAKTARRPSRDRRRAG